MAVVEIADFSFQHKIIIIFERCFGKQFFIALFSSAPMRFVVLLIHLPTALLDGISNYSSQPLAEQQVAYQQRYGFSAGCTFNASAASGT